MSWLPSCLRIFSCSSPTPSPFPSKAELELGVLGPRTALVQLWEGSCLACRWVLSKGEHGAFLSSSGVPEFPLQLIG